MKLYDSAEKARDLAKTLKYNPELSQEEEKLRELELMLQLRLEEAFNAGNRRDVLCASVYDASGGQAIRAENIPPRALFTKPN